MFLSPLHFVHLLFLFVRYRAFGLSPALRPRGRMDELGRWSSRWDLCPVDFYVFGGVL